MQPHDVCQVVRQLADEADDLIDIVAFSRDACITKPSLQGAAYYTWVGATAALADPVLKRLADRGSGSQRYALLTPFALRLCDVTKSFCWCCCSPTFQLTDTVLLHEIEDVSLSEHVITVRTNSQTIQLDGWSTVGVDAFVWMLLSQRNLLRLGWPIEAVPPSSAESFLERQRALQTHSNAADVAFQSLYCYFMYTGDAATLQRIDAASAVRLGFFVQHCAARSTSAAADGRAATTSAVLGSLLPAVDLTDVRYGEYAFVTSLTDVDAVMYRGSINDRLHSPMCAIGHPSVHRLYLNAHDVRDWNSFFLRLQRPFAGSVVALHLNGSPVPCDALRRLFTPKSLPHGLVELSLANASLSDDSLDVVGLFINESPALLRTIVLSENASISYPALERFGGHILRRGHRLATLGVASCGAGKVGLQLLEAMTMCDIVDMRHTGIHSDAKDSTSIAQCVGTVRVAASDMSGDARLVFAVYFGNVVALPPPLGLVPTLSVSVDCFDGLRNLADVISCGRNGIQHHVQARRLELELDSCVLIDLGLTHYIAANTQVVKWRMSPRAGCDYGMKCLELLPHCEVFECVAPPLSGVWPAVAFDDVARVIGGHRSIKTLVLRGYQGGDALVGRIGTALKVNRSIHTLDIDKNDATDVGFAAVRQSLFGNKKLTRIVVEEDVHAFIRSLAISTAEEKVTQSCAHMKHLFRSRLRAQARAACNEMISHKAVLRTLRKREAKVKLLHTTILAATSRNVELQKPKYVKEQERLQSRHEKRLAREAVEEQRWEKRRVALWGAEAKLVASKNSRTVQRQCHANEPKGKRRLFSPDWLSVRESIAAAARKRHGATRTLGRRIDAFVQKAQHVQSFAMAFCAPDVVLPSLEAHYLAQHAAYCRAAAAVSSMPLPSGWVVCCDAFGNSCFANVVSGLATFVDPRLLRESPTYFASAMDVGQTLAAVWLAQERSIRSCAATALELYTYNLYLAAFFQSYAFPLPPRRRPFLYNIPILDDSTRETLGLPEAQSAVVTFAPARILRKETSSGGLLVMSPRLFFAANGLLAEMYESICDSDYATTEEYTAQPYWSGCPDITSGLEAGDGVTLQALMLLQQLYRQIEFNHLPAELLQLQDEAMRKWRHNRRNGSPERDLGDDDDDMWVLGAAALYLTSGAHQPEVVYALQSVLPIDAYGGVQEMVMSQEAPSSGGDTALPRHLLADVADPHADVQLNPVESNVQLNSVASTLATPVSPTASRRTLTSTESPSSPGPEGDGEMGSDTGSNAACATTSVIDFIKQSPEYLEYLVDEYSKAPACIYPVVRLRRYRLVRHCGRQLEDASATRPLAAVITQCSADRLPRLSRLAESLRSRLPFSACASREPADTAASHASVLLVAAVFVDDSTPAAVACVRNQLRTLSHRLVARGHCAGACFLVVTSNDVVDSPLSDASGKCLYPINALRNLSLDYARDQLAASVGILVDVDFAIRGDLFDTNGGFASVAGGTVFAALLRGDKTAVVLPALECRDADLERSLTSRAQLRLAAARGSIEAFHTRHYPAGHGATNTSAWLDAPEGLFTQVDYEEGYEPYVVVGLQSKHFPRYDARFVGYGFNKVQHLLHLAHVGYSFVVCPDAFVMSTPHERSSTWRCMFDNRDASYTLERKVWLQGLFSRFKRDVGLLQRQQHQRQSQHLVSE